MFSFRQHAGHISSNVRRVSAYRHTTDVMIVVTVMTAATNATAVSLRLICFVQLQVQ